MYCRKLLQAGWSLPAPEQWTDWANSTPFDDIANGLETARLRIPLPLARRQQLLEEARDTPETLQAIEECWTASGQIFPQPRNDAHSQIQEFLRNPLDECPKNPQPHPGPAPTLPRFARLALSEHRRQIEGLLGPLPSLLATPAQQRLAQQRLGPL